jgi:hypothetical protein
MTWMQIRNTNIEIRNKSEYQNRRGITFCLFEFEILNLFRTSDFEFRILPML